MTIKKEFVKYCGLRNVWVWVMVRGVPIKREGSKKLSQSRRRKGAPKQTTTGKNKILKIF
jgi:hypothetical protein